MKGLSKQQEEDLLEVSREHHLETCDEDVKDCVVKLEEAKKGVFPYCEELSNDKCYSDHNEDIRVKGDCDYCGGTDLDEVETND